MDWRRKVMRRTVVASGGLATVLVVAGAIAADRPLIDVSGPAWRPSGSRCMWGRSSAGGPKVGRGCGSSSILTGTRTR